LTLLYGFVESAREEKKMGVGPLNDDRERIKPRSALQFGNTFIEATRQTEQDAVPLSSSGVARVEFQGTSEFCFGAEEVKIVVQKAKTKAGMWFRKRGVD